MSSNIDVASILAAGSRKRCTVAHVRSTNREENAQGKVNVPGVAAPKRTPLLPAVPTVEEAGLPGYNLLVWYGFFAPGRMPKDRL